MTASTTQHERPFRVRNFGNDREYDSVEELVEGLLENYRGKSVAVHVRGGAYRMVKAFFVDVTHQGELVETYGENGRVSVDIEQLREAARR